MLSTASVLYAVPLFYLPAFHQCQILWLRHPKMCAIRLNSTANMHMWPSLKCIQTAQHSKTSWRNAASQMTHPHELTETMHQAPGVLLWRWIYIIITRMWANAKRDGRPAEYRWRPLFNAAKFGWRPLLQRRAVMLPRNWKGCPKLANRSQPLVADVHHIMRTCAGGIAV